MGWTCWRRDHTTRGGPLTIEGWHVVQPAVARAIEAERRGGGQWRLGREEATEEDINKKKLEERKGGREGGGKEVGRKMDDLKTQWLVRHSPWPG